jgi:2-oxoisovalerate ferredoxin oxidoreductase beta subunit
VALTDTRQHLKARKAVRKALQNQVEGKGFSFVEVLSACPTGWKLAPQDAIKWVERNMLPVFPLGVYRDQASAAIPPPVSKPAEGVKPEGKAAGPDKTSPGAVARREHPAVAAKVSGFGGQGVLFLGVAMAEAGMREGLQVSFIPSYGPEMRGGTAHCHVRLASGSIASPLINRPDTVIAFNEPSMERFAPEILPGGLLMVNSSMVKRAPERTDLKVVPVPATEAANGLGSAKVANMVMLGAYLEETRVLDPESVLAALADHGIKGELLRFNRQALQVGRDLIAGEGERK